MACSESESTVADGTLTIAVMSSESTGKAGQELVRAERGRFAAGQPSANPKGRPKKGLSLAENWRRETDWTAVRERLEKIVTGKSRDADAVAAARELCDRAWGKPLSSHELRVTQGTSELTDAERLEALATDEELATIERLHERAALMSGAESSEIDDAIDAAVETDCSLTAEVAR